MDQDKEILRRLLEIAVMWDKMPADWNAKAREVLDREKVMPAYSGRELDGYYAVWAKGKEWPELFYSDKAAKQRAEQLSREMIGHTVHVCTLQSVGSIQVPYEINVSGIMTSTPTTEGDNATI